MEMGTVDNTKSKYVVLALEAVYKYEQGKKECFFFLALHSIRSSLGAS